MQKLLTGKDPNCFAPHEALKAKIGRLYQMTLGDGVEKCFCHGDTYRPNWMLLPDGDVILIDWEYAGMNDGIWDLADVSIEGVFTPENDELLLTEYLGSKPDQNEYKHFLANKIYVDYLWTLWAKTRVPYDGQPMEDWAVERYARLKDNLRLFAEA